ncbi:MAG TPA: hypothetical protein VGR57_04580, partial [Ktedonobacterales bacterium]|nr:hypothetical protein [Ktedonobacterales bacterium]
MMRRVVQWALLLVGALALASVGLAIAQQVAATMPGTTPARVLRVDSYPYPLVVRLYRDPVIA